MNTLVRLSALDRKLLRDVWGMKGQAAAIAAVVAVGVAMLVSYLSNFDSLRRTLDAYYDRQRFADVFASLERAPRSLEERIAGIPGVAIAETRVVRDVALDVPGLSEPATGRLISIPASGRPRLNEVFLTQGRWIEAGRENEILLSEPFAQAHGLAPGDALFAVINGRRRELRIVGLGLSPEYIYTIRAGELIPDDRHFAILWIERRAVASAFNMEGGFNDVAVKLMPRASSEEVIGRLDRLLEPYGGLGAIPRRMQISHRTIDDELRQLQRFGVLVPTIFLGVAAFLLNMALTRALAIQRPQIASLKALGYRNTEIAWHYLKWALLIAGGGSVLGIIVGARLGAGMLDLYNQIYRFPVLMYRLSADVALASGLSAMLVSAGLGAAFAVRRAVNVAPAEAMRPEPPARFHRSVFERPPLARRIGHGTRMVLRNLERHPWRATASLVGIAVAVGIFFFGVLFMNVMTLLADVHFTVSQRQDVTVNFVVPVSSGALHELRALPGVVDAEPVRRVAARIRHGPRSRYLAVTGSPAAARLERIVTLEGHVVTLPADGLVMSAMLGEILDVAPGGEVDVEVLEGERPVRRIRVAGFVDDAMGLSAHMEIGALHRLLREGGTLSGANLLVESNQTDALYRRIKAMPKVSGVALKAAALESFRRLMAQNFQIITTFNVVFAGIIAFGVVYNAARISLSERTRELATLRVLGFTIGEIAFILLGELALLTVLALPVGILFGWGLGELVVLMFDSEVYRLPLVFTPQNAAWAALTVIAAVVLSGLTVKRQLDHLDLVGVLKMSE